MANGYEDAARQQGSTRATRYGDRRPYKEAQARGQAVQAKRRQGDQTLRRDAYREYITGDVQPIDDTGYRVQDNYFGPDGLQNSTGSGAEQDLRKFYRNDPDPHYKIKLQDVMDQEQNRWDRRENMGPTAGGDWMSADQQLEKAITDRAMARAEREGLDYWNAPNQTPPVPTQTFDAYTGAQNAALQRNAGLSDREAQLQQSFDQARASQMPEVEKQTQIQNLQRALQNPLYEDKSEIRRQLEMFGGQEAPAGSFDFSGQTADLIQALRDPRQSQENVAEIQRRLALMGQTQQPMAQPAINDGFGNAPRSDATLTPAIAPLVGSNTPAATQRQQKYQQLQAAGRLQPAQQAGQVQAAPPRPAPAKVQPAPTAAKVGKSMGEAVQAPQKAKEAPRSQKQKEDAQTGFVPTQRPAKQRKGYGQGRA